MTTHRTTTQSRPIFIDHSENPNDKPPQISLIPISLTTVSPFSPYISTRRTISYSPVTTTTTTISTSTTTTRRPISKSRTLRPNVPVVRTQDNEIGDSLLRANNKAASARLNMGGIIALGVFGGFVFLAAIITIIVIIVRR